MNCSRNLFKKLLLLVLSLSTIFSTLCFGTVTANAASVPKSAKYYKGNFYYVYRANSWNDAKALCKQKGGHLAIINNKAENSFLYKYIKSLGYSTAYFGITDEAIEGEWRTVEGKKVTYTNWHKDEPNNDWSDEHYGSFFEDYTDGTWNDGYGGDGSDVYICEWYGYKLNVSETKVYLTKGKKKQIEYNVSGNTKLLKSKTPSWKSSNTKVAKVSSNGKIVAINAGSCTITCKVGLIKKTIKVIVKPTTVKNFKSTSKGKDYITLKWNKQTGVKNYKIYVYDRDVEEYVPIKTVNGAFNKTTIYNLKSKRYYKFKVRALVKSGGTNYYGGYSKAISVKTR